MTYLAPFEVKLWFVLGIFVLVLSVTIWLLFKLPFGTTNIEMIDCIWLTAGSLFGISTRDFDTGSLRDSVRLMLFTTFLTGSGFYYGYLGFITSSLAIPSENLPFNSPQQLLKTHYRSESNSDFNSAPIKY